MDAIAYQALKTLQDRHWWFEGRRQVLAALIENFLPRTENPGILEAGCGYGGNLPLLQQFGHVECFEFDDAARAHASSLLGRPVAFGHLPDQPGFPDRRFDLIAMLDVLEHIEDDASSLTSLRNLLGEGGRIVITVPAMPWLWSRHDELHHHKRRYTKKTLQVVLGQAGLRTVACGYFNSLLFPLAVGQRFAQRLIAAERPLDAMPPAFVNDLLLTVFSMERRLIGKVAMPAGLSLFAVAEKPGD